MKIKVLIVGADTTGGGVLGYVKTLFLHCDQELIEFHMTVSGNEQTKASSQYETI
jgi:hypothetical protein